MKPLEGINILELSTMITASFSAMMLAEQGARVETDIVLCNYRPGVMDKLGLGSELLRTLNPRLIFVAVSGFGTKVPDRNKPAYDQITQTQVGFPAVQGHGTDNPKMVRNLVSDKSTAYTVCQAATAALFLREKTNEGQHIDISMMDAALFFLFPDGFMHETLLDEDAEHLAPLSDKGHGQYATR